MTDLEVRTTPGTVELRADTGGGPGLTGTAVTYGRQSVDLGGWVETIAPGALDTTRDVVARWQHDDRLLLGRTTSGTLRLTDTPTELRYDVDLPDTTAGRDVHALVARGDLAGSSFAFRVAADGGDAWTETEDGRPLRTVRSALLSDVSPVAAPAYGAGTSVALRSLADARGLDPDTVLAAAAADDLRALLAAATPTVIDLGATTARSRRLDLLGRRHLETA